MNFLGNLSSFFFFFFKVLELHKLAHIVPWGLGAMGMMEKDFFFFLYNSLGAKCHTSSDFPMLCAELGVRATLHTRMLFFFFQPLVHASSFFYLWLHCGRRRWMATIHTVRKTEGLDKALHFCLQSYCMCLHFMGSSLCSSSVDWNIEFFKVKIISLKVFL